MRSALPGVVIDAPDEERGRRDRVVDATIYLVAFAISAATLAGTWQTHPPWLRVVDIVVGIAALVSLRWRRTHPGAVGIGVGAVSLVILTTSGANLAATFNAAIRARGRDLAVIAGLLIAWAFASPLLAPAGDYWVNAGACLLVTGVVLGWGLFVARGASSCDRCASRPIAPRRPARPNGGGSRARCTTCSPTASRCSPSTPARRVPPRRPGRGGRRSGRRDPRERGPRSTSCAA